MQGLTIKVTESDLNKGSATLELKQNDKTTTITYNGFIMKIQVKLKQILKNILKIKTMLLYMIE